MEKFYCRIKEPVTRSLLLLLLLFVGMTAKATDFTEVTLGTGYEVKFCTNWYGKWTASSDGTLFVKESETADYITVYSDESLSKQVTETALNGTKSLELSVTSGTTYYFKTGGHNLGASVITFTFEAKGEEKITLTKASPADGDMLSVTGSGKVSLTFDRAISVEGATITSGVNSADLTVNVISSFYAGCDFKSTLNGWLQSGAVKEGDDVTITFKGITMAVNANVKYGTDGTLTLNYKAPKAPVTLVSLTKPEKFKESWTAGDADGIVTFTFSGDISTTELPTATISYGNLDKDSEGGYYKESITPKVSGKTVTLDLTGEDRSGNVATVLSGLTDEEKAENYYTQWNVSLKGVKDADGNTVYSDAQGSVGSFGTAIPVDDSTVGTDVTTEFTPADGGTLTDNLEIYISPAAAISSYTGVKFEYEDSEGATQEVVVAKAGITETTEDGGLTLAVPVPAAAKSGSNVVVTLDGLALASGYTGAITATYNVPVEFSVTLLNPESTTWKTLDAGTILKVKPTHYSEIGYMRYAIYDAASGECVKAFSENMDKDDATQTVSYEVFGDYTLYENHTYNLIFDAWPSETDKRKRQNHIGTDTLTITGASEEFKFSTVKYVSIDPAMSEDYVIETTDQNVFTVTFDGKVTLDETVTALNAESGTSVEFSSITAGSDAETADGKTYSTVWNLTVPASFLVNSPTAISFSVKAYDKDGLLVEGNTGEKAGSYLSFSYSCSVGAPDFTITPAEGTVYGKLSTFTASYSGGIDLSYLKNDASAELRNANGEVVATVASAAQYVPDDEADNYSYNPTQVKIVLSDEISYPFGEYTLVFPYRYFSLGSDMTASYSKATSFKFTLANVPATVTKDYDFAPVTVDPADNSTVEKIEAIKLTFSEDVVVNTKVGTPVKAYIEGDSGASTTYYGKVYSDPLDTKSVYVEFDNAITTAGKYTVDIAMGVIGNSEYGTSDFTSGKCNIQLLYTYTVSGTKTETNVTIDPAVGTVTSLNKFTLLWPDFAEVGESYYDAQAKIELKNADGEVVAEGTCSYDWDVMNSIYVTLASEVTAEGTYTLVIPEKYFILMKADNSTTDDSGHTFTYTIGGTQTTEKVTSTPADGSTVTSLKNITLTWDDEKEVADNGNCTEPIVIYDAEGKSVAEIKGANIVSGSAWNAMDLNLSEPITAVGTYTMKVPAGRFLLGSDGDRESVAHEFTYTIESTSDIAGIKADAQGRYNVYNVSGVRIKSTDNAAALKNLKPGLYIINGKKVTMK